MVTTGLFNVDSRIYYIDQDYVIIDNPTDGNVPTIVKRTNGDPDMNRVETILKNVGMARDGPSFYRDDGLWCNRVYLNGAKYA